MRPHVVDDDISLRRFIDRWQAFLKRNRPQRGAVFNDAHLFNKFEYLGACLWHGNQFFKEGFTEGDNTENLADILLLLFQFGIGRVAPETVHDAVLGSDGAFDKGMPVGLIEAIDRPGPVPGITPRISDNSLSHGIDKGWQ